MGQVINHILGGGGGGGSDPEMDAQIRQNEAELEAKKQQLFQQRLAIVKSNGEPDYSNQNPNAPTALTPPPVSLAPAGIAPQSTPLM